MADPDRSDFISPESAGDWMAVDQPLADVVVTSRIRLARNIRDFHFKSRLAEEEGRRLENFLQAELSEIDVAPDQKYLNLENAEPLDRELLLERHLISVELARGTGPRGVLYSRTRHFSVMVNEEDHLRLQILGPGQKLGELLEKIRRVDEEISERIEYAIDPRFGYLTSCPTNVGTGLRLSVMMHLPALVYSKEIEKVFNSAAKMKLAVRGFYGEGTSYLGDFFQVSNQVTLGCNAANLEQDLSKVVPRIAEHEREVRRMILRDHGMGLEDRVYRAYGLLSHARRISSQEALELLSQLRMGVCMGIIKNVDVGTLNKLLVLTQPAHIQVLEGRDLDEEERDGARARYIRERLCRSSEE